MRFGNNLNHQIAVMEFFQKFKRDACSQSKEVRISAVSLGRIDAKCAVCCRTKGFREKSSSMFMG